MSVTTDGHGAFSVADVPLGAAVTLSATAPGAGRTARPVTARPGGEGEPVTLTLDPGRLVAMKGRVVDTSGKPVAGARVHLRRQDRHETGQVKENVPVDFAGAHVLRTDAEGRFETPRGLDAEGEYSAIAEADDFVPGQTPWTRAADRTFPDLMIGPEGLVKVKVGTLEGLARDGSGRPVAGATSWASFPGGPASPEKVTTDAQGRFRLIGLPPTGALVFVEAEGFRFQGIVAGTDNSPVKVILGRTNEPAAGMTTLPPPLPRVDELALARGVIGPFAERVLKDKGADDSTTFRTLTVLAAVDPARVLEAVAAKPFKEGWFNDRLRSDAALALLADGPDEAVAVAESIELAYLRSFAFAELWTGFLGRPRGQAPAARPGRCSPAGCPSPATR
ncbi:MAG: carboxypeptidase-like regulatory domain-containing protein [Singulisphaera sp.]